MKLVGIMPVRNEDWILGLSLRVALRWCDEVLCYFHACAESDQSQAIARECYAENPGRVGFAHQYEATWDEMRHRNSLLSQARERGATHVALIDADEVLTANLLPGIRALAESTPRDQMLDLPLYNLREDDSGATMRYHSNGIWGNRWVATVFEDRTELHWSGDCFHHREPMGNSLPPAPRWQPRPRVLGGWQRATPVTQGAGGVMHFWGASERRLRAKHALYKITERLRFPIKTAHVIDDYYNLAIVPRERWTFDPIAPEWLEGYSELMQYLHVDREPWQEAESKRLYRQYGNKTFADLDLFGVV